jgi:hypothetical protein
MVEIGKPGTFIPRDTLQDARPAPRGGLNDLVLLLAVVFLVASGALAVGVFLYGQFLNSEAASKVTQLQRAEAAFEPSLIQQLTRLDDRMHAADTILHTHIAPTIVFQSLSAATLQTVSYLNLTFDQSDSQHLIVKMQGIAQSVNSIALQADLFSKNGVITSPIFSGIARQSDGVHFDLLASINPAAINYASAISATPQNTTLTPSTPTSPFGGGAQSTGTTTQGKPTR